ncbi:MAG: hypothetical protein HQL48_09315 [Gammaproteobacteria bacterium]|nr:hypothetical protein [Gammaproteobacteria bacterium]
MAYLKYKNIMILKLSLLAIILIAPQLASAVPAFARQTGMSCRSCHFQNFPALNTFGRVFRSQGYTMANPNRLIAGDDLSLPLTLNASIITKLRYQLSENAKGSRGEVQWPDEAALLVGGRAGEKVGFLMELGLGPQEGEGTVTLDEDSDGDGVADTGHVTSDVTGNFLSTKFIFNVADTFSVIPFSTDGLGVGYGFELLNTGVQRSQRPIENRSGYSAYQALGLASGAATGIALAYNNNNNLFINYSHWAPTFGNVNANIAGGLGHYLRVAYMPNIAGWDTGFGATSYSGTIESGENDPPTETKLGGYGVDFQAQGAVSDMPLGIYLSYGTAEKDTWVNNGADDASAFGFVVKADINPGDVDETTAYLGYLSIDDGSSSDNADTTIGVQHMVAQNIKLELYNVSRNNDRDGYTMLMLFAGF